MDRRKTCLVAVVTGYPVGMAKTQRERDQAAREAKLERIQDQIDSGDLVVRKMTDAEQAAWAKRRQETAAAAMPAEKRRAAAAERRRARRAARSS